MSRKILIATILAFMTLFAVLTPLQVRAGGVCGGAYTIEAGDTVEKLAAMCGTSASYIYTANPGLKEPLTVGQTITIPGANYNAPPIMVTQVTPTASPVPGTVINNYNTYNYYNYNPVPDSGGVYIVQPGDTFEGIAYSFGISTYDLWSMNPQITDINSIYVGQALNIPFWSLPVQPAPVIAAVTEPSELVYPGTISNKAPHSLVYLVNKSDGDVYISLRITRADGTNAIYEYPVPNRVTADIPVGWVDYVAWVGGRKFTGGFKLNEEATHTITFNRSKVVAD